MIVVPQLLHSRRRPDLEADDLEAIFVEVSHQTGKTLICCVYCPPVTRASSYNLLHHSLQQVKAQTYTNVCVVGDFNAHIDWNDLAAPIPSGPPDDQLLDVMETSGYIQLCGEASYVSRNQNASFLDLVFTSNPSVIQSCTVQPSISGCDHSAILLNSLTSLPKVGHFARKIQLFEKIDTAHLDMLLHLAPWSIMLDEPSADEMYETWLGFMHAIEKECVPTKTKSKPRSGPWITADILKLAHRKQKLFRKAKKTGNPQILNLARQVQRELKKKTRVSYTAYVQHIAEKATRNPKFFWSFVKRHKTTSSSPVFQNNGITPCACSTSGGFGAVLRFSRAGILFGDD
ncbi:uncharacterized protein ISCGN_006862 [Ixodes scapularis]